MFNIQSHSQSCWFAYSLTFITIPHNMIELSKFCIICFIDRFLSLFFKRTLRNVTFALSADIKLNWIGVCPMEIAHNTPIFHLWRHQLSSQEASMLGHDNILPVRVKAQHLIIRTQAIHIVPLVLQPQINRAVSNPH